MDNKDLEALEEVVRLHGRCLHHTRCDKCPLKTKCLPEHLGLASVSRIEARRKKRFNIALKILFDHIILTDD